MRENNIFLHEQEWTIFTVSEWERTIFSVHEQEWTILKVRKWEQAIFTVREWEQMRLCNAHFQDLKRINWEMTKNQWEWAGKYHLWLLMTNITHFLPFMNSWEQDFLKQSHPTNLSSCTILFRPILSNGNLALSCYLPFPRFSTFRSINLGHNKSSF
jgi:hypothetical protein